MRDVAVETFQTSHDVLQVGGALREGFWKAHPASTASAATIPPPAYAAVLLLTGLILVMGLYPEPFIHLAQVATAGFWNPGGVP